MDFFLIEIVSNRTDTDLATNALIKSYR